jgi:hypothetical protein
MTLPLSLPLLRYHRRTIPALPSPLPPSCRCFKAAATIPKLPPPLPQPRCCCHCCCCCHCHCHAATTTIAALPPLPMLHCRQAAVAAAVTFIFIIVVVAVIVATSVAIAAANFSCFFIVACAPAITVASGVFVATAAAHSGSLVTVAVATFQALRANLQKYHGVNPSRSRKVVVVVLCPYIGL